jgi:hypothetical protein
MAFTTFPPSSAPTTAAPTNVDDGSSPTGRISITVTVEGGNVVVRAENSVFVTVPWTGSSFAGAVLAAFTTLNNKYPSYTVSGVLQGTDTLIVTILDNTNGATSTFTLTKN